MAFKLGGRSGPLMDKGQIKGGMAFGKDESSVPGTPVLRKSLDKGILGEANNDGSIFLSDKIQPGSEQEREVLIHEMGHMTDMKTGKLVYTDEEITYMGETFPRHKGHILYENQWLPEGSKEFPWERMPLE